MGEMTTYCNPVPFSDGKRHTNPDPFIMRWCGRYYCYATDKSGVKISVSDDLVHWKAKGYAIQEKEYHQYWAPSVLYENGIFYMYYSNIPVEEKDCHQQHLKLAAAHNPEGPFVWKKTFFDQFSIDSHPMIWNGQLYMFYSVNDWIGTEEKISGTCILADRMDSPEEFSGNPQAVVLPSLKQEIYQENRFNDGRDWYTIEGACPVVRGDKCWMLYSANAYENVDYFVGTAVAENRNNLLEMEWKKYPDDHTWMPLLKKNDSVEGTGHNSVAKAPNMVDDWIVYHGRNAEEELKFGMEQREMRIDPLYFNADKMLCMGPSAGEMDAPKRPGTFVQCIEPEEKILLAESNLYYHMEFWISAKKDHTGARYGIYLDYQDEKNFLEMRICTGKGEVQILRCRDRISVLVTKQKLPKAYDYTVPHMICAERKFEEYRIVLDENQVLAFTERFRYAKGRVGIIPYFTKLTLHSFALTEHVMLEKEKLQNISHFYETSALMANHGGLSSAEAGFHLESKKMGHSYTEEFLFEPVMGQNKVLFQREGSDDILLSDKNGKFSLYHIVHGEKEWFLADGVNIPLRPIINTNYKFMISGIKILQYRYTKNA